MATHDGGRSGEVSAVLLDRRSRFGRALMIFGVTERQGEGGLSAREEILLRGLIDWVALERVHDCVLAKNPQKSLSAIQKMTLQMIHSLVSDGMFVLGDLSGAGGRFVAWSTPLEESLNRIGDVYVTNFEDRNRWPWICWLDLTDKGQQVAEKVRHRVGTPELADSARGEDPQKG